MIKKIRIDGMKCENCVKHVKESLLDVDGIISADVNLADNFVIVETNGNVTDESINFAVNTEKYSVIGIEAI